MTIEQASKRFNMSVDEIRKYLVEGYVEKNGEELEEYDFENVGLVSMLLKTGMAKQDVCRYLELLKLQGTENERIRLLRGYRAELLDEIHKKQQSLDHIDYIIYEINKQNKK
jgi:DNA-binding transcriptional MerR regulator